MEPIANRDFDKTFMPIAVDVKDKKVLIIGGGKVAWHKVEGLSQFCNNIVIVGKEVSDQIKQSGITYFEKEYEPADLDGSVLVYAATNISELNERVKQDGHARGLLVNVVDNPAHCDFVSPAVYRREFITVAVNSNAQSVYKSIEVRDKIKEVLENEHELFQ
jgi:siroheme synthase-like protein